MTKPVTSSILLAGFSLISGIGCATMEKHASMATVPSAVHDAAARAAGKNEIEKIEKEDENGKTVYEATFEVDGVDHTVTLDERGGVIEEESEVKMADLPPAVSAAVLKAQPLAHAKEAAMVKKGDQSYYEVDAKVGEEKHELSISADGKLISDKTESNEEKDEGKQKKGEDKD